ncbi:MAG: amidophosphoribosyltransferase [Candidatus Omnitrophica bacterium]|nr:amidophosphoribosyltransferase [Candidatus Omnitrophota bacterium]
MPLGIYSQEKDYYPREHCGLFGIYGAREASYLTYLGLYALQHRGEESAGIVSSDKGIISIYKNMGLVNEVFTPARLKTLKGSIAFGHIRYSTTGSSSIKNAQPIVIDHLGSSLSIGHNGNLVNSLSLKKQLEAKGSIFRTATDSEIILHLMARAKTRSLKGMLTYALSKIKGAYSLILMTNDALIGVRDPGGFRPLSLGKKGKGLCLASETCAFDLVGAQFIRDIRPGEVVIIDRKGLHSFFPLKVRQKPSYCIFEHIYFSRPDSFLFGESVHVVRGRLGENLAKEHPVDADIVASVPDSGNSASLGFSHASGIPLEMAIIRNHYVGRTFIQPHQEIRDLRVKLKFNLIKDIIKGKRVVIVDDSIVRGTTSRIRVNSLKEAGAKEVHLRISCPPHKFACFYGIDFPRSSELIANRLNLREREKFLGVDSLRYLSLEGLQVSVESPSCNYCFACFTGTYPVAFENKGKYDLEPRC